MDYLDLNKKYWDKKYYAPNVESFVFRLKSRLLDKYTKKKKLTVLDYGCGEGGNVKYLINSYKYNGYGVDIAKQSIKVCQKEISKKKFKIIKSEVSENDNFFNLKFDLIISIQTLYYLSNQDLNKRLISLNKMLKPNGYVFFTMVSTKSMFWKYFSNKKKNSQGLTLVNLNKDKYYKSRQKQLVYHHYMNFVKSENDVKKKFKIFKPLDIGYYDIAIDGSKKSAHHFSFFGKNR